MRVISVALIFASVFYTNQQVAQDAAYVQLSQASTTACIQETGVDPTIINNIWTQPDFPANNKQLQCFHNCMYIKLGVTDATGKLNDTALMRVSAYYTNATDVKEIGDKCDDIKLGPDLCEYGYLLTKCASQIELGQL